MNKENAIEIIKRIAAEHKGTPQEHQVIAMAIAVITNELQDTPAATDEPDKE
jgi:hypothetical protein